MALQIRPVNPREYDDVARITLAAYDAVGQIEGEYRQTMADTAGRVADGAPVMVAVEVDGLNRDTGLGDTVLGSVTYVDVTTAHHESPFAGDCGFRMLAVDPATQGQGAGRALVQRCIQIAQSRDLYRMAIYSMEWMPTAHGLYGSLGFLRRPDLDVMFPAGAGYAFHLDLREGADLRFPAAGPVSEKPPWFEDAWKVEQRRFNRWAATRSEGAVDLQ